MKVQLFICFILCMFLFCSGKGEGSGGDPLSSPLNGKTKPNDTTQIQN